MMNDMEGTVNEERDDVMAQIREFEALRDDADFVQHDQRLEQVLEQARTTRALLAEAEENRVLTTLRTILTDDNKDREAKVKALNDKIVNPELRDRVQAQWTAFVAKEKKAEETRSAATAVSLLGEKCLNIKAGNVPCIRLADERYGGFCRQCYYNKTRLSRLPEDQRYEEKKRRRESKKLRQVQQNRALTKSALTRAQARRKKFCAQQASGDGAAPKAERPAPVPQRLNSRPRIQEPSSPQHPLLLGAPEVSQAIAPMISDQDVHDLTVLDKDDEREEAREREYAEVMKLLDSDYEDQDRDDEEGQQHMDLEEYDEFVVPDDASLH